MLPEIGDKDLVGWRGEMWIPCGCTPQSPAGGWTGEAQSEGLQTLISLTDSLFLCSVVKIQQIRLLLVYPLSASLSRLSLPFLPYSIMISAILY